MEETLGQGEDSKTVVDGEEENRQRYEDGLQQELPGAPSAEADSVMAGMMQEEEEEEQAEADHREEEYNDDELDFDSDELSEDHMALSDEERQWALEIKAAVEGGGAAAGSQNLDPMNDMSYAVYALVTKGRPLSEVLDRIRGIQQFQKTYGVVDDSSNSIDEGVFILQEFMRLQPLALLNFDVIPETGEGIIVFDMAKYFPSVAQEVSPTSRPLDPNLNHNYWRIHLLFGYYLLRCVQPTFQSIRLGVTLLLEATNVDGRRNLDPSLLRQQNDEMMKYYPVKPQSIRVYNTNYDVTVYRAMIQSFLPDPILQAIRMGCIVDDDVTSRASTATNGSLPPLRPPPIYTLSDLYLQPNTEGSVARLLGRARDMLTRRLQNERTFKLQQ